MPPQSPLFVLLLTLLGVLMHLIPGLTRPGLFFALTVAPGFRRGPEAQPILRRYRAGVWMATLLAGGLELATNLTVVAVLLQLLGFVWALASARRAVRAYAAAPGSTVEVELTAPAEHLPGGLIVALLPVLFTGAVGLWAGLHWDRLPERLAVHWSTQGADRWVAATPATVSVLLAVDAGLCLLLVGLGWGLLEWSRRIATAGTSERRFRRRMIQLLIVTAYFVACPAWFALFQPAVLVVNVWGVALGVVLVGFIVSLIRAGQGGSRAAVAEGAAGLGDRTPDECWKWGLIYVNPADPSVLVEKRFGLGYTLNFGHRLSWVGLVLALVPLAAALLYLR